MKSHFAIQSLYQDHKTWLGNGFRRRVLSSNQPMDHVQDTFLHVLASERAAESTVQAWQQPLPPLHHQPSPPHRPWPCWPRISRSTFATWPGRHRA